MELILAKIHDIYDDDIREEYIQAFALVKARLDAIETKYKKIGFDELSDRLYLDYANALNSFKNEFEI